MRVRGSRRVGLLQNRDGKALHKKEEMDTARYSRKTSETSIKTFHNILKDVGMVVPKI